MIEPFTFLSPLPSPLQTEEPDSGSIGPLTLKECVEIFWLLKGLRVSANLYTYHSVKFEEDDEPYFEEEFSAQISGAQTASCICEHEPYRRANKSGVFFHGECEGDGVVDFSIRGPFMVSEAGAENIPFGERKFMFAPEIEFSCGSLVVSSSGDYFNPDYVRVGNFPYEVLGKTFSLNAFIPKDLAETDANTTFRYSANASIFFEFHE